LSYSNEWTEWHLTPRGWESGSERTDGPGIERKDEPKDRVLTYRWTEVQTSPYAKMRRYGQEVFRGSDEQLVTELLTQFGKPPERL
jgi:hypothetical protein